MIDTDKLLEVSRAVVAGLPDCVIAVVAFDPKDSVFEVSTNVSLPGREKGPPDGATIAAFLRDAAEAAGAGAPIRAARLVQG